LRPEDWRIKVFLNRPVLNTDQGVDLLCKSLGGKPKGGMKVIVAASLYSTVRVRHDFSVRCTARA
jgi:hypothetical protein